ncbi:MULTISPECIES: hypothetical protein [unclassified Streptomyces]|uniref:hypothetical protein n=1 Tax=unclassified Streptomyces TaxID=2593676 RepID=UPI002E821C45|nr:hypothetical protein [Streptomyces sp. NBC_00589]WTI35388.1 hypothetical protein OIC96_10505 [Streptomyces sp. NBC_00775]WUB30938.1 hypothetical protein OHA51_39225 [Streptomyces sp. NBC_00589]
MVDAEIVQLLEQAGPYLTAAVGAYGAAVLTRAEDTAAEATVTLGRRILRAVWSRRDEPGRAALEQAVAEAADEPDDLDAAAMLRRQLKQALREDAELRTELAEMLRTAATTVGGVWAGDHSPAVSHSRIGGDNIQIGHAGGDVRIGPA